MKSTTKTIIILCLISVLYFVLFIAPNNTGAKDVNMIAVFNIDEYAQYPHAIGMLVPGDTLIKTLRNFFIYEHYFYGFPFYFWSAIALLPSPIFSGAGWASETPLNMLLLRQIVNVLPMILTAFILVWMQTRFRRWWLATGLFVLLLAIPTVVSNDLWWHPDSLAVLSVVVTLFFLDLDKQRFGRYFFLAAAACGVAIGIKYEGVFFALAIPIYLVWGALKHKISWKHMIGMAAAFVGIMLAALVISNPLLLLPQERAEIIHYQIWQYQQTTGGIIVASKQAFFRLGVYPVSFRNGYGELTFMLLGMAGMILGFIRPQRRVTTAMMLAFMVPSFITTNNAASLRIHYFIPIVMLLLSNLANFFPESNETVDWPRGVRKALPWVSILVGVAALVQFGIYAVNDAGQITGQIHREETSTSISLYQQIEPSILDRIVLDRKLVILRDWKMYIPEKPAWRIEIDWDNITKDTIAQVKPDVIVLDQANVTLFTGPDALQQAADVNQMKQWQAFYGAAASDQLTGYKMVLNNKTGVVLVKDVLYQQFLQP
ncbi:MAG TPA: hypothetical protein VMC62_07140 [Longilinea sp.]|nr:hypothetical protein [Longilinea sp.]